VAKESCEAAEPDFNLGKEIAQPPQISSVVAQVSNPPAVARDAEATYQGPPATESHAPDNSPAQTQFPATAAPALSDDDDEIICTVTRIRAKKPRRRKDDTSTPSSTITPPTRGTETQTSAQPEQGASKLPQASASPSTSTVDVQIPMKNADAPVISKSFKHHVHSHKVGLDPALERNQPRENGRKHNRRICRKPGPRHDRRNTRWCTTCKRRYPRDRLCQHVSCFGCAGHHFVRDCKVRKCCNCGETGMSKTCFWSTAYAHPYAGHNEPKDCDYVWRARCRGCGRCKSMPLIPA
jgi:hypothetical protein